MPAQHDIDLLPEHVTVYRCSLGEFEYDGHGKCGNTTKDFGEVVAVAGLKAEKLR